MSTAPSKPFHDAIVERVKRIDPRFQNEIQALYVLVGLTTECVIPANHDAIADVFRKKFATLSYKDFLVQLLDHVAAEKARHEKPAQPAAAEPIEIGAERSYPGYPMPDQLG